jgi:hypothetical protein
MSRHGRQTRLAEIGSAGQARIAAATVDVAVDGLAAEVATRYLVGAGVGCVRVRERGLTGLVDLAHVARSIDPGVRVEVAVGSSREPSPAGGAAPGPHAVRDGFDVGDFRDPSARAVARGAHEALRALRTALATASGSGV